jgi:hypothetical protein
MSSFASKDNIFRVLESDSLGLKPLHDFDDRAFTTGFR